MKKHISPVSRLATALAITFAAFRACAGLATYNGYVAASKGATTLVFPGETIAALAESEFSGTIGGAWVNEGRGCEAKGFNKEYRPGESLRVQFQCIDKGDGKEFVKCVRAVFTDSPEGVRAVCDYSGFVTRGWMKNDLGYDFKDDANWKAVDSPSGAGYGLASIVAVSPNAPEADTASSSQNLPPGFSADYDAALVQAKAEGKNLFVLFTGSDWCMYCKKFEKEVLSKPAFLDYATNGFVCVALDFPMAKKTVSAKQRRRNEELQEKFSVRGYPAVLVVSPDKEKEIYQAGYARGGAKKWVRDFKKNLELQPAREKYFEPLKKEAGEIAERHEAALEKIGKPRNAATARVVKEEFKKWADDTLTLAARIKAAEMPPELSQERDQIVKSLEAWADTMDNAASLDEEELIERAGGDADGEDDGDSQPALSLPLEGSRSLRDFVEEVHIPFGERLFVEPELAMLGGEDAAPGVADAIRQWHLANAPFDANWKGSAADYGAAATKAWEAGARTPLVARIHLARSSGKMSKEEICRCRREVWEKWKNDKRWTLAARIFYLNAWANSDGDCVQELERELVDVKKKFAMSGEWRKNELDRAWFVLSQRLATNKQVFEELRAEGASPDPWLEAVALANWHIQKAWKERGDGFASTVTEKGAKLYREHRRTALEWAEKAYLLQPGLAASCHPGIKANYGDREEAQKWYKRSAAIFKDARSLAREFAWGMKPRWGGSTGKMLDFYEMFLTDGFADTLMPAWALDRIGWDVYKDEGGTREARRFEQWAERNAATIRRFGELYLTNGVLERASVSQASRDAVANIFRSAAWSAGDMELYRKWRDRGGFDCSGMKYEDATKDSRTFWNAGVSSLADWAAGLAPEERDEAFRAVRDAFGTWSPWCGPDLDDREKAEGFELFEICVLPKMASGGISEKNAGPLAWGFLKFLAGKCLGFKVCRPEGCELGKILPKHIWVEMKKVPKEMEVEFDLSIDGPETKGEAMLHFDFGSRSKKFYQRFSVLTVANKTDEKDNRFAVLPWPKGETKKSIRLVFRGRDVEVYDNGTLAYTRQLREGAPEAKRFEFARSGHATVKVDRLFVRASGN